MNTIGEHLTRAEHRLQATAESVAAQHRIDAEPAEALLTECRQAAVAVRELLATTWGPVPEILRPIVGAEPRTDRDTLVRMVAALDRRIALPSATGTADPAHPAARTVAAARDDLRHVEAILRAHVRPDRTARTPEAAAIVGEGSRWTLTERIAGVTTALAEVETELSARWKNPRGPAQHERSARLLWAAREARNSPHQADARVLSVHEAGHRPLEHQPLGEVAGLLERFNQRIWARVEAGDLDGVSVRAVATTGVLLTGHLEVISRSAQHRAPELWTGVLGEIREQQLRRMAAEALTARQAWQHLQTNMRPLQPVGQPDVELTGLATQVRAALEAVTRRGDQWRPIEDLVRSRRDAEGLVHGTATVAPDAEALASLLDRGLSTARSADLCIRAECHIRSHGSCDDARRSAATN